MSEHVKLGQVVATPGGGQGVGCKVSSMLLWFANIASFFLPQTRCFRLRGALYRAAGVDVAQSAKINGTARINFRNARIGEETWFGAGSQTFSTQHARVSIGARCDIGPGVMFVAGSHEMGDANRRAGGISASQPISVGDGTWVGTRATFIAGSSVGTGCMVAAGSLVTGAFSNNVLIAGVPARVVRELP